MGRMGAKDPSLPIRAPSYFEAVWRADEAGWAGLGESGWRAVYERQLAMLGGRAYRRARTGGRPCRS
jgi:hypothetical protein